MSDYLKYFNTTTEYETYIDSSDKLLPNISYCEDSGITYYNPNVPQYNGFCKLTLSDDTEVEIEGSGKLTESMIDYNLYVNTLVGVEIGTKCTEIGNYVFRDYSNILSLSISNSVTTIGDYAFSGCTNLSKIIFGNGLVKMGANVFLNTAWYNNQTDGLVYAGKIAYHYKGTMPQGTSITLKEGTKGLAFGTFNGYWNLTNITIPNSVIYLGESAFSSCTGLTSIIIPNSVEEIGNAAFHGCSKLTNITIGSNVTNISYSAFKYCSSLTSITSLAVTAPTIYNSTFSDIKTGGTLTVPSGSSGYDTWMGTGNYYLGKYNWTKVEQ